ncbi:hypothetical protein [Algicola sagamiensis]|uniref:hypothetical protein n=1 Tax=Algicola sagamiensis TaxID=163869 RepID=UPI0003611EDE|nr:hypothetical protein [Algicola sagamiensis]
MSFFDDIKNIGLDMAENAGEGLREGFSNGVDSLLGIRGAEVTSNPDTQTRLATGQDSDGATIVPIEDGISLTTNQMLMIGGGVVAVLALVLVARG